MSPPRSTVAEVRAEAPAEEAPTRQRRKEARPQELLDAALELFVEKGFAATRAEEVAHRAGVSKGTLYLYYPSKEELFKAVVRQNLGSLIAEGKEVVAQFQGSTSELLVTLMKAWWQRVGSRRAAGIHKIILAEVRNFPELAQFYSDEVIEPADALFCSAVQRGITRGEFRALPLHETAHALMAPMIFLALHQHSVGACPVRGCTTVEPTQMLDIHLDLVLRGLEARPGVAAVATGAAVAGEAGSR
ncbi:MAG: TetR/AcrR family transcriptional regulator [Rubrivivax sp.]